MRILSQLFDRIEKLAIAVATLMLLLMGALMNVEIVSRYVFGRSTQIADEYSGYFFTALTVLCFVPALRRGRFLRVSALVDRLPRPAQSAADAFAALLGACLSGIFTWSSFHLAWNSWNFGSTSLQAIQTPLFIPQSLVPVGFALLTLAFIERALAAIMTRPRPRRDSHALD